MIEIVNRSASGEHARVALFDFDGTLSTIRSGWMEVMIPMMVELLAETQSGESEAELTDLVKDFVGRLTGKQTMYQMIELAEEIRKRESKPEDPLVYKRMYLDRLWDTIKDRVEELRAGGSREKYLVPGSYELLEALRSRGIKLYLASGTDEVYMKEEARLLGVTPYFEDRVYGALDDYKSFSKSILIQRIIASAEFTGQQFLGFGDGYVEIENVNQVGGTTIGVATAEPECLIVDAWKRERLISVGADYIIPNYLSREELFEHLFTARAAAARE